MQCLGIGTLNLKLSIAMNLVGTTTKLNRSLELVKDQFAANLEVKNLTEGRVIENASWALKTQSFEAKNRTV